MIKNHLLFMIVISFINQLNAQSDTLENDVFGGFVIAPIEFPIIDNQEINSKLYELDYPPSDYPVATIGIGFQLYSNRWISTLSFNKTTKRNSNDEYLNEVEYRSTSFNLGYDLTINHRYSIYPFFGLKGISLNYQYRETQSNDEISFDEYFDSDLEYKEITHSRMNLDLGVGFSYQWFFLINLRAGYLFPIEEEKWKINNNQTQLNNTTSLDYNYYFTLTIGLGGVYSNQEVRKHFDRSNEL